MGDDMPIPIEKPEWFDLDKYKNSNTKELQQWILNLESRVMALSYINNGRDLSSYLLGDVLKFRDNGFVLFDDSINPCHHDYNKCYIKSLSAGTIGLLYNLIPESTKNDIHSYVNDTGDQTEAMGQDIKELDWLVGDDIYLEVSINAPLEILMEHFKAFVIEQKRELGMNTLDISDSKIADWRDNKVIQYMDLQIWLKQDWLKHEGNDENKRGIKTEMATWLFSEKSKGDARRKVERSTEQNVKDICDYEYSEYMERQNSALIRDKYKNNANPTIKK